MKDEFAAFRIFATKRLNATAYDHRQDPSGLFQVSLQGIHQQFSFARKTRNAAGQPFRLVSGFIDIYEPNAFAELYDGSYYLGMHSALFVAVHEFALFCFTQRNFFPEVGSSSKEKSPRPADQHAPGIWLLHHTGQGRQVDHSHQDTLTPRCDVRYATAVYLGLLMARFVWLHELSHAMNGHVDFVQKRGLAVRLNEVADRTMAASFVKSGFSVRHDLTLLQSIELEADQSALNAALNIQLGNMENIEGIRALDEKVRLKLVLFGAYAMTWLFEEFQSFMDAKNGPSHPAPYLRLQHMIGVVEEKLVNSIPSLDDVHLDVLRAFEAIRKAVPEIYRDEDLHGFRHDPNLIAGLNDLRSVMQEFHPQWSRHEFSQP